VLQKLPDLWRTRLWKHPIFLAKCDRGKTGKEGSNTIIINDKNMPGYVFKIRNGKIDLIYSKDKIWKMSGFSVSLFGVVIDSDKRITVNCINSTNISTSVVLSSWKDVTAVIVDGKDRFEECQALMNVELSKANE
jgi:hypothetical protein